MIGSRCDEGPGDDGGAEEDVFQGFEGAVIDGALSPAGEGLRVFLVVKIDVGYVLAYNLDIPDISYAEFGLHVRNG